MSNTVAVSPVRVAVVQFDPQVGIHHQQKNLENSLHLAQEAVTNRANLIVLPELANTGYLFASRQDAYLHAESIPEGPSTQAWIDFAAHHQVYLVAGLAERDGMQLFDTAVLLGPDGFIGKYRKAHLWHREKLWFTPGNLGFPVFETPIGRIGLMICWDIWFPEVPRLLTQQGADIICSLNNWVWTPPPLFDEAGRGSTTDCGQNTGHRRLTHRGGSHGLQHLWVQRRRNRLDRQRPAYERLSVPAQSQTLTVAAYWVWPTVEIEKFFAQSLRSRVTLWPDMQATTESECSRSRCDLIGPTG